MCGKGDAEAVGAGVENVIDVALGGGQPVRIGRAQADGEPGAQDGLVPRGGATRVGRDAEIDRGSWDQNGIGPLLTSGEVSGCFSGENTSLASRRPSHGLPDPTLSG